MEPIDLGPILAGISAIRKLRTIFVLMLIMSLSLITLANAADFRDNVDIDYSEAVDIMVAASIINGVSNNSFDPNSTLTRERDDKTVYTFSRRSASTSAFSKSSGHWNCSHRRFQSPRRW